MSTAWLFAGHGAQYVGMGRDVLRDTADGRAWLEAAEDASGLPLGRLAAAGPARALAAPEVLEPLLAATAGAHVDRLRRSGARPDMVAAYSAGHVAALYAAGVVDRDACLAVACHRGAVLAAAMDAGPAGGMLSVHGLPESVLGRIAEAGPDPVRVAARNAPLHVTFSGPLPALAAAAARAHAAGAVTALLDVAGAWHTPALAPAAREIAARIASLPFRPAAIPVWSGVTASPTRDPEHLRRSLAASVERPVEWHATVDALLAAGVDEMVEVSGGRSLYALLGQVAPPHDVRRRYLECHRGPARPGAGSTLRAAPPARLSLPSVTRELA